MCKEVVKVRFRYIEMSCDLNSLNSRSWQIITKLLGYLNQHSQFYENPFVN